MYVVAYVFVSALLFNVFIVAALIGGVAAEIGAIVGVGVALSIIAILYGRRV